MKSGLHNFLGKKLIFVSGKGGVGKTTVSLALGLLAAGLGRKTILAEVNSEEQISHLLGRPPSGYRETPLLPGLWGINIHPQKSFEEYVLQQIHFQSLYKAVFENRLVRYFIEATPGLKDLMCIGKIYSLTERYDLVIVDAPATGHAVALLEIPFVVNSAVRVGPLRTESEKITQLLLDPKKTEIVLVTLPEEMPITEVLSMGQKLEEGMKLPLGPVFLNQSPPRELCLNKEEELEIKSLKTVLGAEHPLWLRLEHELLRLELSEDYSKRLKQSVRKHPVVPIPFFYTNTFGLGEVQCVATSIEEGLT